MTVTANADDSNGIQAEDDIYITGGNVNVTGIIVAKDIYLGFKNDNEFIKASSYNRPISIPLR